MKRGGVKFNFDDDLSKDFKSSSSYNSKFPLVLILVVIEIILFSLLII